VSATLVTQVAAQLGEKFLRERQNIAPRQVAGPQQPSAKPGFDDMIRNACRRLLRLREQGLLMP